MRHRDAARWLTEGARTAQQPEQVLQQPVRFGLALHVGTVMYGNIGGANHLDFTCIGPAVNLAARIEKLTGRLGRSILASTAFADACEEPMVAVGEFELAGFAQPQRVFGLPDEAG